MDISQDVSMQTPSLNLNTMFDKLKYFSSVLQIKVEQEHLVLGYKIYGDRKIYKNIFLLSCLLKCFKYRYVFACRISIAGCKTSYQTRFGAIQSM